jgi:hypothetical protein
MLESNVFEIGKRYVFSKRKYIKTMGKQNSYSSWVKTLIGFRFVALTNKVVDNGFTTYVPDYQDGGELVVSRNWCIEIK